MKIQIQVDGKWQHASSIVGADAASDVKPFLAAVAERLRADGFKVRIASGK